MEVVLVIIVLIVVLILVAGGLDNDKPVSEWSDEKLVRMMPKLAKASSINLEAGSYDKSKELFEKKQEVEDEIIRRERLFKTDTATKHDVHSTSNNDETDIMGAVLRDADEGDCEAQALAGSSYLSGVNGFPKDLTKSGKYMLMAAEQGDSYSAIVVSGMYGEGEGLQKDIEEAKLWAKKAKALGHPNAEAMIQFLEPL